MMSSRFAIQTFAALSFGLAVGLSLDHDALNTASSNLVAALSVLNAAIFPTVILSATVLKPADYSSEMIERYRKALKRQISFFFGMLLFSLATISVVLVAQTFDWTVSLPASLASLQPWIDCIYNVAIITPLSFIAMRLPAFFRSLVSLVNVHVDAVAAEVGRRERHDREKFERDMAMLPSVSTHQLPPEALPTG